MNIEDFRLQLNTWGQAKVPFLFVVDFEMQKPEVWKLDEVDSSKVLFNINEKTNALVKKTDQDISLVKKPNSFDQYKNKFDVVHNYLQYGHSFLTNLTIRTPIELNVSLRDVFHQANARYKLLYEDCLVFSPETFIQIRNQKIYSYPMKGTIDASLPDARNMIMSDQKETAEHVTIVDLIRNDLSLVAEKVTVSRFRYIDEIKTNEKSLLQVSSEIQGDLPNDYAAHLGDILISLLPAGSISGAPKKRTVEIIKEAEKENRGYYTGVFGYFDGMNVDSGVMIRYIEKYGDSFYYRSGGGITTQSNAMDEFNEMIDKIYVPVY